MKKTLAAITGTNVIASLYSPGARIPTTSGARISTKITVRAKALKRETLILPILLISFASSVRYSHGTTVEFKELVRSVMSMPTE